MAETKTARSKGSRGNRSKPAARRRSSSSNASRGSRNGAVSTLSNAASKAKMPLVAGGAALAGLAGGVALAGRNQKGSRTKALARAATAVGKAGYRVGELTAEVRKVREELRR